MMKTRKLLLALAMVLLLGACTTQPPATNESDTSPEDSQSETEHAPEESAEPEESQEEENPQEDTAATRPFIPAEADAAPHLEGRLGEMTLSDTKTFTVDGQEAEAAYYLDVELTEDGEIAWDDAQEVTLLVSMDDKVYPLVSKQYTNGKHQIYTCADLDTGDLDKLVVVYQETYYWSIAEYEYDAAQDGFYETTVYVLEGEIQ